MKNSDLELGKVYAVIPAWDYSSAEKKNKQSVRREHVVRAELVNLDKYEYKVYRSDTPTDTNFTPAQQGSRNVGYLVKSSDFSKVGITQTDVYWLARPQDIVSVYADLEPIWAEREKLEAQKEHEEQLKRERVQQRQRQAEIECKNMETTMKNTLRTIIGNAVDKVSFTRDSKYVGDEQIRIETPQIVLDMELVSMLVEKVLEARDMAGANK